jgi:branched-chain amino acid transport system permease protein
MITRLLSNDLPRSRWLAGLLIIIVLGLFVTPFAIDSANALNVAAKIMIFIILAASFDLLLGYTGIFSFAHTMFFGIGAYGVAIACNRLGADFGSVAIGIAAAVALSLLLSLIIGLMSLRVRALFYTMITLAVATAFAGLASQMSEFTGGEDGLTFSVPELLRPGYSLFENPVLGLNISGKIITYYIIFVTSVLLFLALLRIVNSPFGRVLQAIRENDFRAEAIGYRVVIYRIWSNVLAALFATMAGCMLALWLRYNSAETSLSLEIMIDTLLIVVIGGMGTLYGAIIGSTLLLLAHSYLQTVMKHASEAAVDWSTMLSAILHPDRWLLWLGILFVLSVYYFPWGIVRELRKYK